MATAAVGQLAGMLKMCSPPGGGNCLMIMSESIGTRASLVGHAVITFSS